MLYTVQCLFVATDIFGGMTVITWCSQENPSIGAHAQLVYIPIALTISVRFTDHDVLHENVLGI